MKLRKRYFLFAGIVLISGVFSGCSAFNGLAGGVYSLFSSEDTIYVAEWGDDRSNGKHPSTSVGSLAEAVRKVNPGGTIKIREGYYPVVEFTTIDKILTIEGGYDDNYAAIVGKSELNATHYYGTVLHVDGQGIGNTVSISNVIIRSAYTSVSDGSAMNILNGAELNLSNCELVGNVNLGRAAAISVHESILNCIDCKFESNSAINDPAAIGVHDSFAVFDGCIFKGNSIRNSERGRVISLWSTTGKTASFKNCVFAENPAKRAFYTIGGVMIDQGGNVGMLPPVEDVVTAFTAWALGSAAATIVKSGPTTEGDVVTTVMANTGDHVTITMAVNTVTGAGEFTYKFFNYFTGGITYNGSMTANTTGYPAITKFDYSGTLTMTGGELQKIVFDYSVEGTTFSGTIQIDDVYVYDIADLDL